MAFARVRSNGTYALGARTPCADATFDRSASGKAFERAEQARLDDIARGCAGTGGAGGGVRVRVLPPSHAGGGGAGAGGGGANGELVVARTPGGREDDLDDDDDNLDDDGEL